MAQNKGDARLQRQFDRIQRQMPISSSFLAWVRRPEARLYRIPLAILLILGGIFSFLPVLGIWMLPLGLLILALDLVFLQGPVGSGIVRIQRWWANFRRKRRKPKA